MTWVDWKGYNKEELRRIIFLHRCDPYGVAALLCVVASFMTVLAALSEASGSPPHLLRAGLLGGCCQLLHLRLEAADAAGATHPQRRLARALRNCVCAVRRPHLGRAEGSHRLLPLLLRWCEA